MIVPNNLEQAITETLNILSDNNLLISSFDQEETDFICDMHHGLGRWMRNNWGFWKQEGQLFDYLVSIGLIHPDDMSGLILRMTHRKMQNDSFDVKKYVEDRKKYWLNLELELE